MEVGAGEREVRRAVALLGTLAKKHGLKPPARDSVMDPDRLRPEREGLDDFQDAERRKRPRGIRPELDAGPRLLGEARTIEHGGLDPAAAESDGRREAPDAPAGDENPPPPLRDQRD